MNPDHPDDLVTVTTAQTGFEAGILVAVLREAEIEAFAFDAVQGSLALQAKFARIPVQVRQRDLERAREALTQNVSDSVDIDWDEVDVGERLDNLPTTTRKGLPLIAKIGFALAMLILAAELAGFLLQLLLLAL